MFSWKGNQRRLRGGRQRLQGHSKQGANQDKGSESRDSRDCTPCHWEESPSHKRGGTAQMWLRQDNCETKASHLPWITCASRVGGRGEGALRRLGG